MRHHSRCRQQTHRRRPEVPANDATKLAKLAGLTKLERLWLPSNPITDAGLKHPPRLKALREPQLPRTRCHGCGDCRTQEGPARVQDQVRRKDDGSCRRGPAAGDRPVRREGLSGDARETSLRGGRDDELDRHKARRHPAGPVQYGRRKRTSECHADEAVPHRCQRGDADAEWALQSGETVTTSLGEFKAADPLPERDFFAVGLTSDKNNTVTNLGCLNGLTSLTSLNGKGQQITEEWLTHVEQLKNLEKLIVVSSNMSDAGLAQLEGPSNLNQLELISNRQLSGTGFQHLVESNVTVLDCNESAGITDTGLQQLKGMTQLVQLQLMGTQVTDDGLHTSTG